LEPLSEGDGVRLRRELHDEPDREEREAEIDRRVPAGSVPVAPAEQEDHGGDDEQDQSDDVHSDSLGVALGLLDLSWCKLTFSALA